MEKKKPRPKRKPKPEQKPNKKFPYTMYCPRCKTALKIKSPTMVGKQVDCPKCKKRIEVVTPEEDASVGYGLVAQPEPEPEPEPSAEELEAIDEEKLEKKRKEQWVQTKHILSILWLVGLLAAFCGGIYYYVYLGHGKMGGDDKEQGSRPLKVDEPLGFGQMVSGQ